MLLSKINKTKRWLSKKIKVSDGYVSKFVDGQNGNQIGTNMREKMFNALLEFYPELKWDDLFLIVDENKIEK